VLGYEKAVSSLVRRLSLLLQDLHRGWRPTGCHTRLLIRQRWGYYGRVFRRKALGLIIPLAVLGACSAEDGSAARVSSSSSGNLGGGGGVGGAGGASVAAVGSGGSLIDGSGTVERYGYRIDLGTGIAQSELLIRAEESGHCFSFDAKPIASEVQLASEPALELSQINGEVRACGALVAQGETLTLQADTVVPEATFFGLDIGFSRKTSLAGGTFSYLLSWVGGCSYFGPCDSHPGRLATFDFDVAHPEGTVALCPGEVTAGATSTRCSLTTPAPTYAAFAVASDTSWVRKPFITAAGVDIVFYESPMGQLANSLDPNAVSAFMDWITNLLGPFPYGKELRVAAGPTKWLGFEHPANIILREDMPSLDTAYSDVTMHVLMHEIVHQWAGDKTTLASEADFVWKEATCEYLSYVFEDLQGPPGYADATRSYWHKIAAQSKYHPRPTDEPLPSLELYYGDSYGPGPMVLFLQLEALIGRDKVLVAIQDFLSESAVRSVSDLQSSLEKASAQDLSTYFNAWVFGSGSPSWPSFSVSTSQQGDQVTVSVTQAGFELFGCSIEVDVASENETVTAVVDFGLAPTKKTAEAMVQLNGTVTTTTLDPRLRVVRKMPALQQAPPVKRWMF
jgi:aminopeptidase N